MIESALRRAARMPALFGDVRRQSGAAATSRRASAPIAPAATTASSPSAAASALDAGKADRVHVRTDAPALGFRGHRRLVDARRAAGIAPVVAVPTTAGTGSEVGRAAVILNEETHQKKIIFHPQMMPKVAAVGCRSIMIKGLEALTVECLLTARRYGVEDQVLASLDETYPGMDWQKEADYLVSRVVQHGRRRAADA